MKRRLIAGTINHYPSDDEWENYHLDVSNRGIWDKRRGVVQPDYVADMANMPVVPSRSFDEVKCHHALEHLSRRQAPKAISEFYRVLAPGGVLDIAVPNLYELCRAVVNESEDLNGLLTNIYGEDWEDKPDGEAQVHRWGYTEATLRALLESVGFVVLEVIYEDLRIRAAKEV